MFHVKQCSFKPVNLQGFVLYFTHIAIKLPHIPSPPSGGDYGEGL
jgi:hypothetical protein